MSKLKPKLENKSKILAERMNRITKKLSENINLAEEVELTGDDIIDFVNEKTQNIDLYSDSTFSSEIINLKNMLEDFKFVRDTLRENTANARRVLNSVTTDLLDSDEDKRASLIMSFAELNKAVADNIKLYITSYKDISNVLLNINKIKETEDINNKSKNVKNVMEVEAISTADLVRRLSKE